MKEKKEALNSLRGLMAVAIVLSHCGYLKYYTQTEAVYHFVYYLYGAVTFFFVLAGYFFCYTKREESFSSFLLRKYKRVYPLHIITLLCSVVLLYLHGQLVKEKLLPFLANLFLVQGLVPDDIYYFSFNAVSWFLSILLICYVAGFVLVKYRVKVFGIALVGYIVQLILCITLKTEQHWLMYINPIFRVGDFCMGVWLCEWSGKLDVEKHTKRFWSTSELISLFLFLFVVYLARNVGVNWTFNVMWLIPTVCLIVVFSFGRGVVSRILKMKGFQLLGVISMELFMTHKFIVNNIINVSGFIKLASKNAYLSLAVVLLLCLGVAVMTHCFLKLVIKVFAKGK